MERARRFRASEGESVGILEADEPVRPTGLQIAFSRLQAECEWNRIIALGILAALGQRLSSEEARSLAAAIQANMAAVDHRLIDLPDDAERLARAAELSTAVRAALRLAGPSHE